MNFNFLRKIFKINQADIRPKPDWLDVNKSEEQLLDDFKKLTPEERIKTVIHYGDSGHEEYFYLLKWTVFHDVDKNVKLAALKRIHLFKDNSDVVKVLNELPQHTETFDLEPYYSMALSRVGIISLDEFKERMDNAR